jgi:hypothetical protein
LIRAEVEVRVTARTVEVFHRGQRGAVHQRRYMARRRRTDPGQCAGVTCSTPTSTCCSTV